MSDAAQSAHQSQQLSLDPTCFAVLPGTVGVAYDSTGAYVDTLYTTETCISYANDGYHVTIPDTVPTGSFTPQEIQRAVDAELRCAIDCFGPDHLK